VTDFLNSSAFSLTYYLFTLFAIESAFFIALGHWRRNLSLVARRLAIGFGVLGGGRLILALLAGLVNDQIATHAIAVISLALLAWNFSPYLINLPGFGIPFVTINTFLALVLFGIQAIFAPVDALNFVWLLWQIGLALFSLTGLFQEVNQTRFMIIISFVLFALGSLLQLTLASSQVMFIRLSEMIVYPILAVAVYQTVIESLNVSTKESEDLTKASLEQIERLISLFETTKNVTSSLELSQVLDGAARGVVEAVKVDQCAIALPEEGEASQLRMVAMYNPRRAGRGEAVTFPASQQPAIKHALDRLREIEINSGYDAPDFKFLFALMGATEDVGPLVIQPLVLRNTAIGVLIVGNPYSKQPFGPTKVQLIRTMANQIAIAIDNARAYQMLATQSQQLAWTLRNQEQDSSRRQAAMEAELKKSREEVTIISQRLYEQDSIARKSQKELTEYQQQAGQLNSQLKQTREVLDKLKLENQQISALTDAHKKELDKVKKNEEELITLKNQLGELEAKATEVDKLRSDLANAQQRSQKLIQALRSNRAKIQHMAGMPTSITSPQISNELENLSCGLLISDTDGTINRVNTAATKLFDCETKALVGKKLADIASGEKWQQALNKITASDEKLILTSFLVDDKMIKASISPMVDSNRREINGNIVILYDATEELKSQQAKDEFVASLSQDLRTPMTSITGYIDLLLVESVGMINDMQRKFLQRVKSNIERMELMLRDLIGVTAIDAGQYDIKPVPLNLAEVIEDAIIGVKSQIEEKEIQLHLDLPEEMPPVEVDPDCIHQVMANLLGNATKITPVGGDIEVSALVTSGDDHNLDDEEVRWLQISVTDSGGGIAEKDIDRVFDRFYMAEQPLIQGLGETGVGLSIVKYIIEAHGGRVWLDTDIGGGSSFHFTLLIKDYYNDPWQELDVPPLDLNSDLPES